MIRTQSSVIVLQLILSAVPLQALKRPESEAHRVKERKQNGLAVRTKSTIVHKDNIHSGSISNYIAVDFLTLTPPNV